MAARRQRSVVALACAALCALGVECRTTRGPTARPHRPPLEIAPGDLDDAALDARIARIEAARGLDFIQRPRLEIHDADDPRLAALVAAAPIALVRSAGLLATQPLEHTSVDPERERISTARPVDEAELDVALAFLLDAQHAPRLVPVASAAGGDPGIALRALFHASALATAAGGLGPTPDAPPPDPLAADQIGPAAPEARGVLGEEPIFAAQGFLRALEDREAAFRRPPLSTEQILRPERWQRDDRPVALEGAAPSLPDCALESDASFGVFRLLRALVERGAGAPSRALAAWRGDRLLRWRCGAGSERWLYVVELDDVAGARAFASTAGALLPESLGEPDAIARSGRRVAVSGGIDAALREAFVTALRARELRLPEDAVGGAGAPEATP